MTPHDYRAYHENMTRLSTYNARVSALNLAAIDIVLARFPDAKPISTESLLRSTYKAVDFLPMSSAVTFWQAQHPSKLLLPVIDWESKAVHEIADSVDEEQMLTQRPSPQTGRSHPTSTRYVLYEELETPHGPVRVYSSFPIDLVQAFTMLKETSKEGALYHKHFAEICRRAAVQQDRPAAGTPRWVPPVCKSWAETSPPDNPFKNPSES